MEVNEAFNSEWHIAIEWGIKSCHKYRTLKELVKFWNWIKVRLIVSYKMFHVRPRLNKLSKSSDMLSKYV